MLDIPGFLILRKNSVRFYIRTSSGFLIFLSGKETMRSATAGAAGCLGRGRVAFPNPAFTRVVLPWLWETRAGQ